VSATGASTRISATVREDVWEGRDTDPDAIDAALRRLLHERHVANNRLVPARVLNLVVICERSWKGEVANRLERVGRYHASRTVLCAIEEGRRSIDARALLSYEEPRDGGLGLIRERVELDLGPQHLERLDSIVDPVLVGELPTVLWRPHGDERGLAALRPILDVVLLDCDEDCEPARALERAHELLSDLYVVDLAWLRTTPWRERLAASFDAPWRRAALLAASELEVRHQAGSRTSALLLAGWLASRLDWRTRPLQRRGEALHGAVDTLSGSVSSPRGQVRVTIAPVSLEAPGLGTVRLRCEAPRVLEVALRRARGGLRARELVGGRERCWQILGASRGEGGILGEGVRQALLRDDTYGPALARARELCAR
jgi:glucose-6-phosphate dehydrogenase assembly protein OpcA